MASGSRVIFVYSPESRVLCELIQRPRGSSEAEEIEKNGFVLTPGRYVGLEEVEDDGEPFEEKMERLTNELGLLFAESNKLEEKIKDVLGELGYGV